MTEHEHEHELKNCIQERKQSLEIDSKWTQLWYIAHKISEQLF